MLGALGYCVQGYGCMCIFEPNVCRSASHLLFVCGSVQIYVCFSTDHFADFVILHAQSSWFVWAYPVKCGVLGRACNLMFVAEIDIMAN